MRNNPQIPNLGNPVKGPGDSQELPVDFHGDFGFEINLKGLTVKGDVSSARDVVFETPFQQRCISVLLTPLNATTAGIYVDGTTITTDGFSTLGGTLPNFNWVAFGY